MAILKKTHPNSEITTAFVTSNLARGNAGNTIILQMLPIAGVEQVIIEYIDASKFDDSFNFEEWISIQGGGK